MAMIYRRESDLERKSRSADRKNLLLIVAGSALTLAAGAAVVVWGLKHFDRVKGFTTFLIRPLIPAEGFFRLQLTSVRSAFYTLLGMLMPLAVPALVCFLCLWAVCELVLEDTTDMDLALVGRRAALFALERMPDHVHVFTNLRVGVEGQYVPTDLITVSPGGVTVIQVKHRLGPVEDDPDPVSGGITGPSNRLGAHAERLAIYLRRSGLDCPVASAVYDISSTFGPELRPLKRSVPVFRQGEEAGLRAFVMDPAGRGGIGREKAEAVARLLSRL